MCLVGMRIDLGLSGHSDEHGRDLLADAMRAASERLSRSYGTPVHAVRRDERGESWEGFSIWSTPPAFVPVRRRHTAGQWREVQSVQEAAAEVGTFLRALDRQTDR